MDNPIERHVTNLIEEAQYLCRCPECNDTAFPTNMLHWHKDGFYCEHCFDEHIWLSYWQRGRSLDRELRLKAERGRCYRKLPDPLFPCADPDCEWVWFPNYLLFDPVSEQFLCREHSRVDSQSTHTLASRLLKW